MTATRAQADSLGVRTGARTAPLRVAAALGVGLGVDVAFDPHERHVPLCPLHAVTGIWCPLCGGLRAADSLAHGRIVAALHENALFVTALPLLFAGWLYWLLEARSGRSRPTVPRTAVLTVVVIAIAFTVVRNLPFVPGLRGA